MNDQLVLDIQLRSDLKFDNFLLGDNEQVLTNIKNIQKEHDCYFLWGVKGSGKTHLLNALCHDFQHRFPDTSLAYLPLGEDIEIR